MLAKKAEATIKTLKVASQELLVVVPVKVIEELLLECMGLSVFTEPPELERAHRSMAPKPAYGRPASGAFNRKRHGSLGNKP